MCLAGALGEVWRVCSRLERGLGIVGGDHLVHFFPRLTLTSLLAPLLTSLLTPLGEQMEEQVLLALQRLVRLTRDPLAAEVASNGVQGVVSEYSWRLKLLFAHFSIQGIPEEGSGELDVTKASLPLTAFVLIGRQFGLVPERIGVKGLTRCFQQVSC